MFITNQLFCKYFVWLNSNKKIGWNLTIDRLKLDHWPFYVTLVYTYVYYFVNLQEPLKLPISAEQKELMKKAQEFSKQQQEKNGGSQVWFWLIHVR